MPWAPPIKQADLLDRGGGGGQRVGEHADIDDGKPVGEHEQLVQILGNDQHGGTVGGQRDQGLVNGGGGAGIDTPGGLRDHEHARVLQHLAADDELLQVAAGEAARQRVDAGRADIEFLDDAAREVPAPCRRG